MISTVPLVSSNTPPLAPAGAASVSAAPISNVPKGLSNTTDPAVSAVLTVTRNCWAPSSVPMSPGFRALSWASVNEIWAAWYWPGTPPEPSPPVHIDGSLQSSVPPIVPAFQVATTPSTVPPPARVADCIVIFVPPLPSGASTKLLVKLSVATSPVPSA